MNKEINSIDAIILKGQVLLFAISSIICLAASLNSSIEHIPFIGIIDVSIAALLFSIYIYMYLKFKTSIIDDKVYKKAFQITLNLFSLSFIFIFLYIINFKISWYILIIGLSWRYYLLKLCLPYYIKFQLNNKI